MNVFRILDDAILNSFVLLLPLYHSPGSVYVIYATCCLDGKVG